MNLLRRKDAADVRQGRVVLGWGRGLLSMTSTSLELLSEYPKALGFGQMKKGRSVPVCHSGQTNCQTGLMNIEIDLNSWRERERERQQSCCQSDSCSFCSSLDAPPGRCYMVRPGTGPGAWRTAPLTWKARGAGLLRTVRT